MKRAKATKAQIKLQRRRKRLRKLKAACLSLGLATAWGTEAKADVTFKLELSPAQTLSNAIVLYGNNVSTAARRFLGTIPGGVTTTIHQTLVGEVIPNGDWTVDPNSYVTTPSGFSEAFYAIVGLYDNGGTTGVSATFPNDTSIALGTEWSTIFEDPALSSSRHHTETEIVIALENVSFVPGFPELFFDNDATDLMETYGGRDDVYNNAMSIFDTPPMNTPYGKEATFLNFSSATFGGTVTVSVVPEPTTSFLFTVGIGLAVVGRLREHSSQP